MSSSAQPAPGITRIDLQQDDLSVPGREMVQHRVEISPEAQAFRHFHYGEEIIYVLEGELEYHIDGEGSRTVRAGEGLMVPAQAVHAVQGNGTELATYIVESGKPLITLVDERSPS
jgi:quercetin dioxygenase-like cupin family protein